MESCKVSASQISTWQDCQRKWAYEQLMGLRPEANASAALGGLVHKVLESAVQTGLDGGTYKTTRKAQNVAEAGMAQALQLHSLQAKVEHRFSFVYDEIIYNGFVDAHVVNPDDVFILDWKTSSDPDAPWILTEDTLPQNVQGLIYAKWGMLAYDKSQAILRWVYLHTRKRADAKPVEVILDRAYVDDAFDSLVHPHALAIKQGRTKAALELPQNFASCGKYGGCPHKTYCWASGAKPADRLRSLMSQHLRGGHLPSSLASQTDSAKKKEDMQTQTETTQKRCPVTNKLLAALEAEEASDSAANEAQTPPEEAPTQVGRDAQAAAYEAAGQRLPPRKRGRPAGSKNKPKETEDSKQEKANLAEEFGEAPLEGLMSLDNPEPKVHIYDLDGNDAMTHVNTASRRRLAIDLCLDKVLSSANALDALHWARAAVELGKV